MKAGQQEGRTSFRWGRWVRKVNGEVWPRGT